MFLGALIDQFCGQREKTAALILIMSAMTEECLYPYVYGSGLMAGFIKGSWLDYR